MENVITLFFMAQKQSFIRLVLRGARRKCPKCGEGKIYERWNVIYENCLSCGWALRKREPDSWFFMYISTAFTTGIFIVLMLVFTPSNLWVGRLLISIGWFFGILLSIPNRKGIAFAIECFFEEQGSIF